MSIFKKSDKKREVSAEQKEETMRINMNNVLSSGTQSLRGKDDAASFMPNNTQRLGVLQMLRETKDND